MEAKDFRLGNWVETYVVMIMGSWIDKEGKHQGVDEFTTPKIREKQIDIEDLKIIESYHGLATYRGIPLSSEILERCGFECDNKPTWFPKWKIKYTRVLVESVIIIDEYGSEFSWIEGNTIVPIQYLHELQNLFYSLTKTELNYQP